MSMKCPDLCEGCYNMSSNPRDHSCALREKEIDVDYGSVMGKWFRGIRDRTSPLAPQRTRPSKDKSKYLTEDREEISDALSSDVPEQPPLPQQYGRRGWIYPNSFMRSRDETPAKSIKDVLKGKKKSRRKKVSADVEDITDYSVEHVPRRP
jgi:hypothetical protein